jgi:hypothetical protein
MSADQNQPTDADASQQASERALKLTAAVYTKHLAADYLREHGRLPDRIGGLWSCIPMRLIIEERGTDITLTPDEQLVYDAIVRERRLPGGSVLLAEDSQTPILHYPGDGDVDPSSIKSQ